MAVLDSTARLDLITVLSPRPNPAASDTSDTPSAATSTSDTASPSAASSFAQDLRSATADSEPASPPDTRSAAAPAPEARTQAQTPVSRVEPAAALPQTPAAGDDAATALAAAQNDLSVATNSTPVVAESTDEPSATASSEEASDATTASTAPTSLQAAVLSLYASTPVAPATPPSEDTEQPLAPKALAQSLTFVPVAVVPSPAPAAEGEPTNRFEIATDATPAEPTASPVTSELPLSAVAVPTPSVANIAIAPLAPPETNSSTSNAATIPAVQSAPADSVPVSATLDHGVQATPAASASVVNTITPSPTPSELSVATTDAAASEAPAALPAPAQSPALTTSTPSSTKTRAIAAAGDTTSKSPQSSEPDTVGLASPADSNTHWQNLASTADQQAAPISDFGSDRTVPVDDPTRLVARLSQHIQEARDTGRQLTVRITPPDLGPLRIDVSSMPDGVRARLETSSVTAEKILQQGLPQLHDSLTQLGVAIDRIEVVRTHSEFSTGSDPSGGGTSGQFGTSPQSQQDAADRNPQRPSAPESGSPTRPRPAIEASRSPATGPLQIQELNVRV